MDECSCTEYEANIFMCVNCTAELQIELAKHLSTAVRNFVLRHRKKITEHSSVSFHMSSATVTSTRNPGTYHINLFRPIDPYECFIDLNDEIGR